MKDLIVLVPDKDTQFALEGILGRHDAFHTKRIEYDIFVHPLHDPGVYKNAVEFLRPYLNQYKYALVFLDREGSGQERNTASQISHDLRKQLERNGWSERAEVIVFDPELEIWAWVDSAQMAQTLGWMDYRQLKNHLIQRGFWQRNRPKPQRPKEAFEWALRSKGIPRSSSMYKEIADQVSFNGCVEASFEMFRTILKAWFGKESPMEDS